MPSPTRQAFVLDHAGGEPVPYTLLDEEAGGRQADLACVGELGAGQEVRRLFRIDVAANDGGRVAAQLHRDRLHGATGCGREQLADRDGAGECDLGHGGRRDQVARHLVRPAEHDRDGRGRHPRIQQRFRERQHRARRFLRRLADDGASGAQSARKFLGRQRHREVPWREGGDNADRVRLDLDAMAGVAALERASRDPPGLLATPLKKVCGTRNLRLRLSQRLTLLPGHGASDRIDVTAQPVRGGLQDRTSLPG